MDNKQEEIFERPGFIFYRSYKNSINELDDKDKLILYEAIANYGLDKKESDLPKGPVMAVFQGIKAQLDANWRKYLNSLKGGAPIGNKNAKKNKK